MPLCLNDNKLMERCIFNVYTKDSILESARQSMKPYAESEKVPSLQPKAGLQKKKVSEISTFRQML